MSDLKVIRKALDVYVPACPFPRCVWCGATGETRHEIRHADDCHYMAAREALERLESIKSKGREASPSGCFWYQEGYEAAREQAAKIIAQLHMRTDRVMANPTIGLVLTEIEGAIRNMTPEANDGD